MDSWTHVQSPMSMQKDGHRFVESHRNILKNGRKFVYEQMDLHADGQGCVQEQIHINTDSWIVFSVTHGHTERCREIVQSCEDVWACYFLNHIKLSLVFTTNRHEGQA